MLVGAAARNHPRQFCFRSGNESRHKSYCMFCRKLQLAPTKTLAVKVVRTNSSSRRRPVLAARRSTSWRASTAAAGKSRRQTSSLWCRTCEIFCELCSATISTHFSVFSNRLAANALLSWRAKATANAVAARTAERRCPPPKSANGLRCCRLTRRRQTISQVQPTLK